ncbi:MAG TPA: nucleoside phosphorylase [Desulfomonilia bacterium]|nr:nucleoside phosphorylase [Deltaproteobacteria bacterium]HPX51527.1 nucleoside phosphorylase [Deltaproteobacteria bacterium]HRS57338.1 nucleoside phosphorylase [Desulfomonilia bacterium]HRV36902.1 nucleoside phosphorylase [Desulfomonilia bacterium]
MVRDDRKYHIGFSRQDLCDDPPADAILCGDPERTRMIATEFPGVELIRPLSENRGLSSFLVRIPGGRKIVCATSGMGAPSLSIVVNELVSVGISRIVRVGTTGSIQDHVRAGSIVITRAALCRQGAALDIAPPEYPAAADLFLTMALVRAAQELGVDWHLGITASVDTFFEGQERTRTSANPHLLRHLTGITDEYRKLNILNFEMECGTLLKMAGVYGFSAGCVCAVIDDRTTGEDIDLDIKAGVERDAARVALKALERDEPTCMQ